MKKLLTLICSTVLLAGFPNVTLEPANAKMLMMNPKEYASYRLTTLGYKKNQFNCLVKLWNNESHWNPLAVDGIAVYWKLNGKWVALHAKGIAQRVGETSLNPRIQINHGISYIQNRYGSPCDALSFWNRQAVEKGTGWS